MRRLALVLLLSLTGCHSYLLPFDERPINAPLPLRTAGGERIDLDGSGQLTLRPGPEDVSATLGVSLFAARDGRGLVVTNRLRPGTRLEPEDRIVYVAAVIPNVGRTIRKAHTSALAAHIDPEGKGARSFKRELEKLAPRNISWGTMDFGPAPAVAFDYFDPTIALVKGLPGAASQKGAMDKMIRAVYGRQVNQNGHRRVPLPTPAELRARKDAHPVRSLADLRGYLCGVGWLHLDLLVVRGEKELVIRQQLKEETRWLPVRLWREQETRWSGVDLVKVSSLSPETRPQRCKPTDLLVVRVARDAPLGRAGLRPLDLVARRDVEALLGWKEPTRKDGKIQVRSADGRPKLVRPRDRDVPTNVWIPFLLSYQRDGVRTHLGIGPFDLFFHLSSRLDYDPRTGSYERVGRWSLGTSIQGQSVERERGTRGSGGVNPIVDVTRLEYLLDYLAAPDEQQQRTRGWR